MNDEYFMECALTLAAEAERHDEVPVGAVLVRAGQVIGRGFNRVQQLHDPTAHAECLALRAAGVDSQNYRLPGTTLYVTLEPCMMCFGALIHARVQRLVYGADEAKFGVVRTHLNGPSLSFLNHRLDVTAGILAAQCSAPVQKFFQTKRSH